MKVALTVWGNRISPVFDSANLLLIAEIENATILKRGYERLNPELPVYFINTMSQLGITTLICGAISQIPANIIEDAGIKLIPFISGDAETILAHFSKNMPITPKFLMPGCGKMQHGHGRKKECLRQLKEEGQMPRRDGTGPKGQDPGTGKGKGRCKTPSTNSGGSGKGDK
jgi:predicted Fe-Mo cluster-binding NifX family protein